MKKICILSLFTLLALGMAGCAAYYPSPYSGIRGDYGFTYDLDNTPSPFVDTGYRPLTPYDLAAPIIVVVTNQPPPRVVYQEVPRIGETVYSGESPVRSSVVAGSPAIIESAGAQPGAGAGGTGTAGTAAPPGYNYGGDALFFPGDGTNTNLVVTNITSTNNNNITNTNGLGSVTNTNIIGGITNTNELVGATNPVIGEPAGTQLQTNQGIGEPPGTELQSNRPFGEPPVPPRRSGGETNRILLTPPPQTPAPAQPQPQQAPVPQQGFGAPQQQRPVREPAPVQQTPLQRQRFQSGPPASAPQTPPAPAPVPAPAPAPVNP